MIAGDALRLGVEHRLPVHDESIVVMAMPQLELGVPRAIGMALHRMRRGMPVIEIAGDEDFPGIGSGADEIDRLADVLGGVTIPRKPRVRLIAVHCSSKTRLHSTG